MIDQRGDVGDEAHLSTVQSFAALARNGADQLSLAGAIAEVAHAHQRYGNEPYIEHCRRVADRVCFAGGDETQIAAALLHDVLEDTRWSAQDLREAGVADGAIELVEGLTRRAAAEGGNERYLDGFIARIARNPRLALIKRADLLENLERAGSDRASLARRNRRALERLDQAGPQ